MYGKEKRESVFEIEKVSSNHDTSKPGVALMTAYSLGSMTCVKDSTSLAHGVSHQHLFLCVPMGLRAARAFSSSPPARQRGSNQQAKSRLSAGHWMELKSTDSQEEPQDQEIRPGGLSFARNFSTSDLANHCSCGWSDSQNSPHFRGAGLCGAYGQVVSHTISVKIGASHLRITLIIGST